MDDPYARRRLVAGILVIIFLLILLIGEAMRDRTLRRWAFAWLGVAVSCAALVGVLVWLLIGPARAHDHEHPELDSWYPTLESKGGHPCCDGPGKDATHVADIDWESKDGHYRVRISGKWYDVPEDAVIEAPNRDGRAIVWGYPITSYSQDGSSTVTDYHIRCFIPGADT